MNFEDDPEARIRALEQPLSDQARASELGGAQAASDAAYLPPPVSAYSPPNPSTPTYGTQDFGTQPYGTQQWGTQQWGAAPTKVSGGIPWVIFGMIAVVILVISAGIIVFVTQMTGAPDDSSVPSGGGSIDITLGEPSPFPSVEIQQAPTVPGVPAPVAPGADPNGTTAAPGQTVAVSGVDENKTVTCKGGDVSVSGIRNTVTIIGHCAQVAVSGIENNITVDAADKIGASGFDNKVTYHGGTPQIDASGSNTVQQG